jgi:hypothetical protein
MDECVLYRPQYLHIGDVIARKPREPTWAFCVCWDTGIYPQVGTWNGPTRDSNETHTNFASSSKALEERGGRVPSFTFQYRPLIVCGHVASWLTVSNIRLTDSHSCWYLDTNVIFVYSFMYVAMLWALPTPRAIWVIGTMHELHHMVSYWESLSKWYMYCHFTKNQGW